MNSRKKISFWSIFFVIVPLLFGYLYQLGDIVETSYQLNNEQAQLEKQLEEKAALESQAAKMISLAEIEGQIQQLNFVPVQKVKYLSLERKTLAQGDNQLSLR